MRVLFSFLLLVLLACTGCTGYRHIRYTRDNTDFVNPERGFYLPTGTKASKFEALNADLLTTYRTTLQSAGKSSYKVQVSLIYRGYELDAFVNQPLSEAFLQNPQSDFDAVRQAGLKMILRFAYTNTAKGGDCTDEYKICPPYGDASTAVVLQHIAQLKPVLQTNSDVIAVLQEGFIGIWGENYFTDYFGDASTNGVGRILDSSWRLRNQVLQALLDALPNDRMVQVRTPQIKQKFIGGPTAPVSLSPVSAAFAHTTDDAARIGFHNDCLLATADDYGTFYDYGSSSQPRQPANEVLRRYMQEDARFVAVGGETCDDAYSPQNDCSPAGHAEEELRQMHYSYLNAGYNTDVNNDWDSAGCLQNIRRHLGYRLALQSLRLPKKASRNQPLHLRLTLTNQGYAAPFNPRPVYLVLRERRTQQEQFLLLKTKPQIWYTGSHTIQEKLSLLASMPPGEYEAFLFLPDAAASLRERPEYSIRLASENGWDPVTGYNRLHCFITIQ